MCPVFYIDKTAQYGIIWVDFSYLEIEIEIGGALWP